MHIFFSGIGGTGIGPLALIAKQAGYDVSGSDKQESQYINYLKNKGINLYIGQSAHNIEELNGKNKINWYVYSSALPLENPDHPELQFIVSNNIKHSKRDEFLNYFLNAHQLKLLAFAGTHGKTSSTAMAIWVFKQLKINISYSLGAKISFGEMGQYIDSSEFFIYECDEFDRNFLTFSPYLSVLSKVDWDHHEIFPHRINYIDAFKQFCNKSKTVVAHKREISYLSLENNENIIEVEDELLDTIKLAGQHNRENASAVATAINKLTSIDIAKIIEILNNYPGSNRRFERIAHNIYTDYGHTPEEISATLQMAKELKNEVIVVYEPLTNRRQHYMINAYKKVFTNLKSLYWVPSYLAREDPNLPIILPQQFVGTLDSSANAKPAQLNDELKNTIFNYSKQGFLVILFAGGGGGSLDEWARKNLVA